MILFTEQFILGRKTIGTILLFLSFATVLCGQNVDTKNLLKTWDRAASGGPDEEVMSEVEQTVVLNQTEIKSISFSAESKAENVSGDSDDFYSIYLNLVYMDGSRKNGISYKFKAGTHDWEKGQGTFTPDKPIKSILYVLLFRKHLGKIWFRNAVLTENNVGTEAKTE